MASLATLPRRRVGASAAATLAAGLALLALAPPAVASGKRPDNRHASPGLLRAGLDPSLLRAPALRAFQLTGRDAARAAVTPPVGTVRTWVGADDREEAYYPKLYTLLGVGRYVEIWVANELAFPSGDCRNSVQGGARLRMSAGEVGYLVDQFDRNIYPKESQAFSVPPNRDGTQSQLNPRIFDPTGSGEKVVLLVDNVRDESYYDPNNSRNLPYVAGFFSAQLTEVFDRNIMTIDAYDWLHRTGPNPPHEPVPGDLCASAPARPFSYEGVVAHEYQHLLEYYEDRNEVEWVNEGLSDYAETLVGYADTRRSVHELGYEPHVQCFLGWLGTQTPYNPNPRPSGPENSLTAWGDAGGEQILCDYGAAYSVMLLLADRYGIPFMSALHREDRDGLAGLQRVLNRFRTRTTARRVVQDWAAMVALDDALDRGARLQSRAVRAADVRARSIRGVINWETPLAYARTGAPPNGSDYVRLRDARGRFLSAAALRSLSFAPRDGARLGDFTVQLVSYRSAGGGTAHLTRVTAGGRRTLTGAALRRAVGASNDVVAVIVTFHAPEGGARPARYRLTVNGVTQPGG